METNQLPKFDKKALFMKIVLLSFVLLLLFAYSNQESENRNYNLIQAAFLYEGDELVGVNVGEQAEELTTKQQEKATEVTEEHEVEATEVDLSTKVVNTPSLVAFDLTENEQTETITYATEQTKPLEQGYTITIDNKYKYYVKEMETLDWAIEKILLAYVPDSSYVDYYNTTGKFKSYTEGERKYTDIDISNEVTITEGYLSGSKYIENDEDLLFELFHQDQDPAFNIISNDINIKDIKETNEMDDITFKLNNPSLSEDALTYNGQRIVTNELDPIVDVVQTFETSKTEEVKYETIRKDDDTLLAGQVKVETEGEVGEKVITYENKMINGEVVSTEKTDEEVTKKPTHRVLLIGPTATYSSGSSVTGGGSASVDDYSPSGASSAGLIWPSSSRRVTCEWGCYGGHTGMDIQSYYGGPIYAAQSGTVTTSGYSPYGYGYYVVIDHGGGVSTLYAHQSQSPPVSVGQSVTQGQVIGFEGNTGNVYGRTGVHLHFEVRINGTPVNPRGYL